MSESVARIRRIRDALEIGNVLTPEDAAALSRAISLAVENGIPIELGLKAPARWRNDLRIMDALDRLSELRSGASDHADAIRIYRDRDAMKQLAIANHGKTPSVRTLRRWLGELGPNYGGENGPSILKQCLHDEDTETASPSQIAVADRR